MHSSTLIPPVLLPVTVFVVTLITTVGLAFLLVAVTHVAHRTPQDHCWICRRERGGR